MSARRPPDAPSSHALAIGLGLVALILGACGVSGLARVRQLQADLAALERDVVALHTRAEDLKQTVDRLRNDPAYIEKLAREERGLVRQGETVLKFPSKSK